MSDNKKTGSEGSFLNKVGDFFKKVGTAIADFAKKAWAWFLAIDWNSSVKPVVGWSVFGGVVGVSVLLMLICWL